MANYQRATGEAQASNFETLSSLEFYSNPRESYRLCVTAVKGTPKLNLSKFWFNSKEQTWLPNRNNFFFSKEAWETLVKDIAKLNNEIQKQGLFGMCDCFISRLISTNLTYFVRKLSIQPYYFLNLDKDDSAPTGATERRVAPADQRA